MIWEIQQIQQQFMRHYKVNTPQELKVADGDYLVPIFDTYFQVTIKDGAIWINYENWDKEKATVID